MIYTRKPDNTDRRRFNQQTGKYRIFDHRTNTYSFFSLDELKALGEDLPAKCKEYVIQMDAHPDKRLKPQEQQDLLLLLSLSMGWGTPLAGRLSDVHINDVVAEVYIWMIKYLREFDRSKGCWVARCKWLMLDVVNKGFLIPFAKSRKVQDAVKDEMALLFAAYPELFDEDGNPV